MSLSSFVSTLASEVMPATLHAMSLGRRNMSMCERETSESVPYNLKGHLLREGTSCFTPQKRLSDSSRCRITLVPGARREALPPSALQQTPLPPHTVNRSEGTNTRK